MSAAWNALFNGSLVADPVISYLIVSSIRILLAINALWLLRALVRYGQVAVLGPLNVANLLYTVRWWLALQWRVERLLKGGAACLAAALVGQVVAGVAGKLAAVTPATLLTQLGLLLMFVGMARFFNSRARQLDH